MLHPHFEAPIIRGPCCAGLARVSTFRGGVAATLKPGAVPQRPDRGSCPTGPRRRPHCLFSLAPSTRSLVKKIQQGKARVTDLTAKGATQLGVASDDYAPCADSGQNCANDIYAVSLAGATPSAYVTWFQAQVA
jgi:hypothetical protein